jgi:cobalamin biosynthesis protein CobT
MMERLAARRMRDMGDNSDENDSNEDEDDSDGDEDDSDSDEDDSYGDEDDSDEDDSYGDEDDSDEDGDEDNHHENDNYEDDEEVGFFSISHSFHRKYLSSFSWDYVHLPTRSVRRMHTTFHLAHFHLQFVAHSSSSQVMTEEQKAEEVKRMFSIFAARMFEQRVLQALREKDSQLQLLREVEDEDKKWFIARVSGGSC